MHILSSSYEIFMGRKYGVFAKEVKEERNKEIIEKKN